MGTQALASKGDTVRAITGRTMRPHAQSSGTVHFACDPASHRLCIVDAEGWLLEAFGEAGTLPGQFDRPSDAIVVSPHFDGEDAHSDQLALVAVADRGNDRVQVFEPEGQLVAIIGGDDAGRLGQDGGPRDGWPFFRLDAHPRLIDPTHLRWEDPWLVVTDGQGGTTRIDLASALLPSFDAWLAAASTPMLAAAHHHFRHKTRHEALAAPLSAIETALGERWLEAGDLDGVARLWSLGWMPHLAASERGAHVAQRDRAAMRAAFRLGGAGAVSRVRAAIRLSLGAFATWPSSDGGRGGRATREAS